jgi:acyl-CoA synthetase (NDP forming)
MTGKYIDAVSRIDMRGKPLMISIPARNFAIEPVIKLEELGFPVYDAPETAVTMLAKMYRFYAQSTSTVGAGV